MIKARILAGTLGLLGLAAVTWYVRPSPQKSPSIPITPLAREFNGQPIRELTFEESHTPEEVAKARRDSEEAYRYKGTIVIGESRLVANSGQLQEACKAFTDADFIPAERTKRFAAMNPKYIVVNWHLAIEKIESRAGSTNIRVRVSPLLNSREGGIIGVRSEYFEDYRISGKKLVFLGGDSTHSDPPISMMGSM